MAKTKVKKVKASSQYQRKMTGMYKQLELGKLDKEALQAAAMYADPCGADLVPSVYPGDRGFINRFTNYNTVGNGATETCAIMIWRPGTQGLYQAGAVTSATTAAVTYGTFFPGLPFLNTNASKTRCAAFCATVRPVSAPNTATGTIYFGIVNARAVRSGATLSPNDYISLCSESVSCSQALMAPLEVRWSPGDLDARYSEVNNPNVAADDSDYNVLIVVAIGIPANTGMQFRATAVMEWAPNANIGITNDATSVKPSACDKECVINYLKKKDRDWWWNLGKKTLNVGKSVVQGYYTGGAIGAMGSLLKYAK
ncbi:hypothetical protein 2 [Changjiang tombus-like virus 14]|uniref:hypothetical protein 2 n=1 Tax=Changjiang tombus-like virus 14 TaxID=1922807 RepID=UPI00090A4B8E|nr:hypothetical protein 2 [Changjiang tombus-like virus 14]APG76249.1 hypothetical protein 2 [Changjiang tombus-like virus 14]